jgi:hypothetical protein
MERGILAERREAVSKRKSERKVNVHVGLIGSFFRNDIQFEETSVHSLIKSRTSFVI